ncbi:Hypermethylated in cancer 2 protein [Bagarius yarrelli]|uniref:Hypermethylated in cancer 2 protein n=1 Tax=Bagarius yarrelli TaxID=175774 RepID=A0A556UGC0_BAGYA|nr:Hypermethylated in cancer 2 protein [Bagarius yarrelli]
MLTFSLYADPKTFSIVLVLHKAKPGVIWDSPELEDFNMRPEASHDTINGDPGLHSTNASPNPREENTIHYQYQQTTECDGGQQRPNHFINTSIAALPSSVKKMAAAVLQTRITAILDVLTKAAVAEISQLIQDDSAVYQREMKRREDEIEGLKKRLQVTEKELKKVQASGLTRCSVGVQVEVLAVDLLTSRKESLPGNHLETFKNKMSSVTELEEEKPRLSDKSFASLHRVPKEPEAPSEPVKQTGPRCDEDEFSSLEFEMKIEQVEELVDQELSLPRADYSMADPSMSSEPKTDQRDTHLWPSLEDSAANEFSVHESCIGLEQYEQIPTDHCLAQVMKDPLNLRPDNTCNSFASAQGRNDREMRFEGGVANKYGQTRDSLGHAKASRPPNGIKHRQSFNTVPRSHAHLSTSAFSLPDMAPVRQNTQANNVGSKPFRCEECGKGFTQRMRLITHKRIHTGEKPYHCQLCGKMFSRQDNCLRHVRLHSAQGW